MIVPETREYLDKLEPVLPRRARRPVPRQPEGPRLGVRAFAACRPSCASTPRSHRVCLIGHSHVALSFSRGRRRIGQRPDPRAGRGARPRRRRVADQPGQRRPAARRRPSRRLARARPRRLGGGLPPHRVRHRGGRRRDPRRSPAGLAGRAARVRPVRAPLARRTRQYGPAPSNRKPTGRPSKVRPRMRYAPRAILAGGLGFAVSCVAACGGGAGLLSGDQSIALSGQGNEITSAVQSGNCGAAINASAALNRDVQNLPVTVNPTLRSNLSQGALDDREARRRRTAVNTRRRPRRPRPRRPRRPRRRRPRLPPRTTTSSTSTTTTTTSTTSTIRNHADQHGYFYYEHDDVGGVGPQRGAPPPGLEPATSGGTGAGNSNSGGNGGGG